MSGDVTVNGSGQPGLLTVTTVSGDADVSRVAGEVNGNTVSGNFTIAMGDTSRSRLRSTSGDLGLPGACSPRRPHSTSRASAATSASTSQGPVGAEFDVSSFNGDIRNCFGPKPVRTSEYAPGSELRFREGQGTRAGAHQDPERRHQRLQQMSHAAVSNSGNSWRIGAAGQGGDPMAFFAELKRRRVGKVAIAYGAIAWGVTEAIVRGAAGAAACPTGR